MNFKSTFYRKINIESIKFIELTSFYNFIFPYAYFLHFIQPSGRVNLNFFFARVCMCVYIFVSKL